MASRDLVYVLDIIEAGELIQMFIAGKNRDDFLRYGIQSFMRNRDI